MDAETQYMAPAMAHLACGILLAGAWGRPVHDGFKIGIVEPWKHL